MLAVEEKTSTFQEVSALMYSIYNLNEQFTSREMVTSLKGKHINKSEREISAMLDNLVRAKVLTKSGNTYRLD